MSKKVRAYIDAIAQVSHQTRGVYLAGSDRPWGVEWSTGETDPFTGEPPVTWYRTAAEGVRAAQSLYA